MPRDETTAPLTDEQAVEVRRLYREEGYTQGQLARKFQKSVNTIGRCVRFESHQNAEARVAAASNIHPTRITLEGEREKEVAASEERFRRMMEEESKK